MRDLPWIATCKETQNFIKFWFVEPQRSALARLAFALEEIRPSVTPAVSDALQLALSRIIVTKHVGASLAWDVSHSRPHRKRTVNDFDVYTGFTRSASRLATLLEAEVLPESGKVQRGDCRKLGIKDGTIDAVVTSPPYLNAIDYLRGHKLSLVWMGYTIPELRHLRAGAVGSESCGLMGDVSYCQQEDLEEAVPTIRELPPRQRAIVYKYAVDADLMLREMARVVVADGKVVLVLGDSTLRGVPVENSRIFKWLATRVGFDLVAERKRPLADNRRYLPMSADSALGKRMKHEVIQAYRVCA